MRQIEEIAGEEQHAGKNPAAAAPVGKAGRKVDEQGWRGLPLSSVENSL